ncbi:MAG TPA: hypothetical protein VHW09_02570 [Bryobacteraceae bacterium]|jgi:hypothetical protein|nr:hypothetical protein [Bryobacteraceae bacterium]
MQFARVLLPVLLTLTAVPASADTLTDLLPPDTKVVFGVRVHNLALSSMATTLAAQAHTVTAAWLKTAPLQGIDFLHDIDEVLVATSGKGKTPPALIVATGRFDVARLAEGARHYYRNVPLLGGEKESDGAIALLDRGLAVLGDANLVRAAIDQRSGENRIDAALNDRITSLRQRYDIWGLGEQPEGFTSSVPEAKAFESIDRFEFGIQLASGLELGAELHTRSAEDAGKLHTMFGMIAAMVKGQKAANGAKFDVQLDDRTFKLNVYIPEAELKKVVEAQTAVLSPVTISAPTASPEAAEAGTEAAPDPPAAAPAPATPTPAPRAAKPTTAKVRDSVPDTVVFTLPGKK